MINELIFPKESLEYVEETLPDAQPSKPSFNVKQYPMSPKHKKRLEKQRKKAAKTHMNLSITDLRIAVSGRKI